MNTKNKSAPYLKPCPFCGAEIADLALVSISSGNSNDNFIACDFCDACGPRDRSEDAAIDKWNERKPLVLNCEMN